MDNTTRRFAADPEDKGLPLEPCPWCGVEAQMQVRQGVFHHKPSCFLKAPTIVGASQRKAWNTRRGFNEAQGGHSKCTQTSFPVPDALQRLVHTGQVASAQVRRRARAALDMGYAEFGGSIRLNGEMTAAAVVNIAARSGWVLCEGCNAIRWFEDDPGTLFFDIMED